MFEIYATVNLTQHGVKWSASQTGRFYFRKMTPVSITSWTGVFVGPTTIMDTGEQIENLSPLTGDIARLPDSPAVNLVTILTLNYEEVL
jgi:hypothetical protein